MNLTEVGTILAIGVSFGTLATFGISVLNSRYHAGIAEGTRRAEAKTMIENDEKLDERVKVLEEKYSKIDKLETKMDFALAGIEEIKMLFRDHIGSGDRG